MALPQKNKNTKRADAWRRSYSREQRQRSERRKIPTWEQWWAGEARRVNQPTGGFRPDVRLDPSQVNDWRPDASLVETIWRWWDAKPKFPGDTFQPYGPTINFDKNTPFGKLQTSAKRYKHSRMPEPGAAPSPSPAPIRAPIAAPTRRSSSGVLSQYRRK